MDWLALLADLIVIILGVLIAGWIISWNHERVARKHAKEDEKKKREEEASSKHAGPKQGQKP